MTSDAAVLTHQPCPSQTCGSSDAYSIYEDGHGYCFSCNNRFNYRQEIENEEEHSYEYLSWRGVEANTFRQYNSLTKIGNDGKPISIGFRYNNGSYKVRSLSEKKFWSVGDITSAGLFGKDKFASGSSKFVTITEGELDALSLYQVLHSPVVSVQSSSSAVRDCTIDREWLLGFDRIYLAFDNDTAGRAALQGVAKLFDYNKIFVVKFSNRKDANAYVEAGESIELKNIWWNSKKYLPDTVISSFSDFKTILSEKPKWGVKYPFPTLNRMTYGIRTGESILITAQEGVGKTELMHNILYQLLKETQDGVGAIFLEEPKQRLLQAVAGLELKSPVHLPDSGHTADQISAALEQAVQVDDRLHIYSHFGSDDPDVLADTIRFLVAARSCRYILLDHITMVISGSGVEDERRKLDQLVTRLEMLVKELDFALIMVSHVNDEGQTRGSRYISKVADLRIDISRELLSLDPATRNTLILVISKNRYCGKTGPAGKLLFDNTTYTYKELEEEPELEMAA